MKITNRGLTLLLMVILLPAVMLVSGCSSSPSEEEMKQLNDLKDEYAQLQKKVSMLSSEKEALEKEVADKNAKLKKCNDDQQVVRQRLGK
jgi:outer membrane murein-binding lipoprotein Lpp